MKIINKGTIIIGLSLLSIVIFLIKFLGGIGYLLLKLLMIILGLFLIVDYFDKNILNLTTYNKVLIVLAIIFFNPYVFSLFAGGIIVFLEEKKEKLEEKLN